MCRHDAAYSGNEEAIGQVYAYSVLAQDLPQFG